MSDIKKTGIGMKICGRVLRLDRAADVGTAEKAAEIRREKSEKSVKNMENGCT